jgi:hypothetical protein
MRKHIVIGIRNLHKTAWGVCAGIKYPGWNHGQHQYLRHKRQSQSKQKYGTPCSRCRESFLCVLKANVLKKKNSESLTKVTTRLTNLDSPSDIFKKWQPLGCALTCYFQLLSSCSLEKPNWLLCLFKYPWNIESDDILWLLSHFKPVTFTFPLFWNPFQV